MTKAAESRRKDDKAVAAKEYVSSKSGPPTKGFANNPAIDFSAPEGVQVIDQTELNDDLISTAKYGSAEDVRKCLRDGANVLATNSVGETALHLAARFDNNDTVMVLLEQYKTKHLDVNTKDDDGWTPLYGAVGPASVELVSMILSIEGVDLRAQIPSGQTPLYRACYYGNAGVAKLILGTKVGADTIEVVNDEGWTPLHAACSEGQKDIVEVLLDQSPPAKADRKDPQG